MVRRLCLFVLGAAVTLAACNRSPNRPTPPPPPVAPTLTCPANIAAESPDGQPVTVSYATPVAQGGTPPVNVTCGPSSGSAFPVGTTNVACSAHDSVNRTASCRFSVKITKRPPAPKLRVTRFMAFGDSLTEGTVSLGPPLYFLLSTPQSYPTRLQALLTARYTDQTVIVINEGFAGRMAKDDLGRFHDALKADHPQALLLMHGANDLNTFQEAGIGPAVGAIEKMVNQSRQSGVVVFLATLPPERRGGQRANGINALPEFNKQIRAVARDEGAVLVDLYKLLLPEIATVVGKDGLHLTEPGYERVAEVFLNAIKNRLEVSTTLHTAAVGLDH